MRSTKPKNALEANAINSLVLELVHNMDAMIALWDIDQVCIFANDAYFAWFGKSREEMKGITMKKLLGDMYALNLPYIRAAYAGELQIFEREIKTPDGKIRHSLATYTPYVVDGQVAGIFVHVADVTSMKNTELRLRLLTVEAERLATHDFLTGLPNRVLLEDRIAQALALARRAQKWVAMLSVDLDEFKQINDAHGHPVGDEILKEVASRLAHSLRETDSVTRMGGDEFLVLLPTVDSSSEVEILATRILEKIRSPINIKGTILSPSCSVGIAVAAPDKITAQALIHISDQALYAAKKLGKNRFAFANPYGL